MGKRERKSGAANEKQIEKSIREKQKKQHWKRKFCNFPEVFGNACAKCNTNDLFYCIFHTVSERAKERENIKLSPQCCVCFYYDQCIQCAFL